MTVGSVVPMRHTTVPSFIVVFFPAPGLIVIPIKPGATVSLLSPERSPSSGSATAPGVSISRLTPASLGVRFEKSPCM